MEISIPDWAIGIERMILICVPAKRVQWLLPVTGMGAAVYTCLNEDELCATVEIKIVYMAPVTSGRLTCDTEVVHLGKRIVMLESEVKNGDRIVAKATGTYSLFKAGEG